MKILEKVTAKGLSRIELIVDGNSIKYEEYLNNKSKGSGKKTQVPFNDALLEETTQEFIKQGYIKVETEGTLEVNPSKLVQDDLTVRQLTLEEFQKEYPHINLSGYAWSIGEVEVYSEDVVIDGDLNLEEESDFTKKENGPFGLSEVNSMIFLKNLTVNGSIYSGDQDVDRALRVMGNLTANNMIIGGSQIYLEGKTKIRDALIIYPDVDFRINDVHSSLYIKDHYNSLNKIQKASFDYTIYFDEELALEEKDLLEEGETISLEEKVEYFGVFFKGKKQTWINNEKILSEQEVIPFLTDKNILNRIKSMIEDIEEE